MKRIISAAVIIFSFATFSFAQPNEKEFKPEKARKEADQMMELGNVYGAVDLYEKVMEVQPDNADVSWNLAQAYYFSRDYANAEGWYKKAMELDEYSYPSAKYWYAMMMKMNGKYEQAKKTFDDVAKTIKGEGASEYKKWAKTESKGCDLALRVMQNPTVVNINHLGREINSNSSDISPRQLGDTALVFASVAYDSVIIVPKGEKLTKFVNLYKVKKKGEVLSDRKLLAQFNIQGEHSANPAFSADGKKMYFTRCEQDLEGNSIICHIYVSTFEKGKWSDAEEVGGGVNDPEFTSTQPTIASQAKGGDVLYYVSNRTTGGKGGLDIWYSSINKSGDFSLPKNCGSKINSTRDEYSPWFDNTDGILYFSSNGWEGIGGFDIYKTSGGTTKWGTPENIGYPVNSSVDDMYYVLDADQKKGYMVSNRPGTFALRSETCCDDIWRFEYPKVIKLAVQGYVYDIDDKNPVKTPIDDAGVYLALTGSESGQDVIINTAITANKEMYFFSLNVNENYKLKAEKKGWYVVDESSKSITTVGMENSDTLRVDLYIQQRKILALKNIYYPFDKWDILPEAEKQLDSLYEIMVDNPLVTFELGSHTDSRGSDEYNQKLSQNRAKAAMDYLIKVKGADPLRLSAVGYGEAKMLKDCVAEAADEGCTDDASQDCPCHQKNRRTEFKAVGEIEGTLYYEDVRYEEQQQEKEDQRENPE